jgi:hypothetical protein
MYTKFRSENLNGRSYSEDICIDGIIILECILKTGLEGVNWMYLARDRDLW